MPEELGCESFWGLIIRNRRACGVQPSSLESILKGRYEELANRLRCSRREFRELGESINRIVWQLLGVASGEPLEAVAVADQTNDIVEVQ